MHRRTRHSARMQASAQNGTSAASDADTGKEEAVLPVPDVGSMVICRVEFPDGDGICVGRVVAHIPGEYMQLRLRCMRSQYPATAKQFALYVLFIVVLL